MRISDWSSDVCSSDLVPPSAASGRPAAIDHHRLAGHERRVVRGEIERQRGDLLRLPQPPHRLARAKRRQRAVEIAGRTQAIVERRGFDRAGADRVAADALRSEEHTSELQSLMRISYAVFCLKK